MNWLDKEITLLNSNWNDLGKFIANSDLKNKIEQLYASDNEKIRPQKHELFNAFKLPLNKVKVVILGQDPYPSDHAHGLAFSSQLPDQVPKSLANIFKALQYDFGEEYLPNIQGVANLTPWLNEGVFLLNTRLTVNMKEPLAPEHDIWEDFIVEVFKHLAREENLVYLLWGKHAQKYLKYINKDKNFVIETVHPSPLSAYRGFFTANCFLKTNQYLESVDKSPIKW
ncbi:uracil-DNA glycosylase [Psittacicella hinzii]|uniref:Uracil-DNA glycosylase n=1 Tax=Psittacicella hinzii TaxID=2028575 RepID=A0A3A1YAC4_9GAMM|nr:uracil-DNA glycosylase [Psittacicella hinzii]RIY34138.1 uracil-DNA glycosylase [Psittacicella hinzii]